ncbi:Crp/Fnr family transcriptional regulator [Pseudochryseolinea flava]|uniref:Crp/Fnr family transcriptional regulator n=1 Tax=Pseudochryseolinea flava TaxID=2059302 RepID=A0A364XW40_9BACT|nr:Crp/Fnr family transcriptional regulator [Pseudochryseolinea flava]
MFRKHLEVYTTLSDDEYERVLTYFVPKKLKKHEFLVHEGDWVTNHHWVIKGLLVSNYTDDEGKDHIMQFAIENCWITDQDAFYNQTKAIFNITCLEDTTLMCLSFSNREKMCADMHKMEHYFRKKGNDSFVKQQRRLLSYMTNDAKGRFNLLMAEYPGLYQRLSKKILAAYLGVTRETLSRFKF